MAHQILEPVRDPETGHASSPVIAAALCITPRGNLILEQTRKIGALKEGSPSFTTLRRLAMRFNGILHGRKADPRPAWIDDAIEMEWSSGQAEGQINRLTTLNRAIYGRTGPNLLGAGMLPLQQL